MVALFQHDGVGENGLSLTLQLGSIDLPGHHWIFPQHNLSDDINQVQVTVKVQTLKPMPDTTNTIMSQTLLFVSRFHIPPTS